MTELPVEFAVETTMTASPTTLNHFLGLLAERGQRSGLFGPCRVENGRLVCDAKESAAPAQYRVEQDQGRLWVVLVTADRWLSESIETDLLHTGDKLNELVDEELVELGYDGPATSFQHYRSDDKLFTFRTEIPVALESARRSEQAAVETAVTFLLGYEACFRRLGDMQSKDQE
ncbi:MAG: hypothetical protein AMXMBFR58_33050 [Phycisphaerae bacterium]|nr:hypothetical protein [Phycisphaerales bacterium]